MTAKQLSDAQKRSMNAHVADQQAYLAKIEAGGEGGAMPWPEPVKRARSMGVADGITMLKGGLDLISAVAGVSNVGAALNYLAGLQQKAQVGLSRLDWVSCHQAAKAAAIEAQKWERRLAVTVALLAHEEDPRRQTELRKNADTYRYILIDQQLKPFVESRLASTTMDDDSATCGPAFNKRLKPVASQLGSAAGSNESALAAGAAFLNVIATAFAEWDHIVMEGLD